MGKRFSIFSILISVVVVIGGCFRSVEPPVINGRDRRIPQTSATVVPVITVHPTSKYPPGWVPPRGRERRWKAIIIHHSAQSTGNMAMIDKYHREVNGWDGVGYDFVIGNGKGKADGQVEVTFRWRKQIAGAHCGGTPNNRANESGIGICLIGDFTKTRPTYRQMSALKKLVRFLQKRYKIPTSRIYGHSTTPGYTRGSICPGKNFPMAAFKRSLRAI
ncbi:MAG: N-acetylmuramoyl-L-alanine amidase [Planctomycetota bacterium]|nr:MAG: N-acetylmuramoyl-L-alanine amidase [Planctomycetota bacterium]